MARLPQNNKSVAVNVHCTLLLLISSYLLRFRHIDEFSFQQEQMHKFGGSGSVLGEGGLISYPRGGGGARVPGWDPAPGQQPPAPTTQTNAFTPIWPAVPAQKRSLSPSQPAVATQGPNTSQQSSQKAKDPALYDSVPQTIPSSVSAGMRQVMERVIEATTPLSKISYREQLKKKTLEAK